MSILRVMTPSEIDRYAKTSTKSKVRAMAAGAESFDLEHSEPFPQGKRESESSVEGMREAQIIPLHGKRERSDGKRPAQDSKPFKDFALSEGRSGRGPSPPGQAKQQAKSAQNSPDRIKQDSSIFLLEERERLKRSNIKIAEAEALKTYCQAAGAEFFHAEIDLDDPDAEICEGGKGILINKKHF